MGRDEKRRFKPNKKHFELAKGVAIKERRNAMPDDHANAGSDVTPTRAAFYDRIGTESLAPLWEVLKGLVRIEPQPTPCAHIWRYDRVRPYLMEAGALVTAEEAERRVLVLENPALPGRSRATATLYAGIQLVLPGEIARRGRGHRTASHH